MDTRNIERITSALPTCKDWGLMDTHNTRAVTFMLTFKDWGTHGHTQYQSSYKYVADL